MHRPRYHRTPAYLQDPDVGSATPAARSASSSSGEPSVFTGTGSGLSGGSSMAAKDTPQASKGTGGPLAAVTAVRTGERIRFAVDTPNLPDNDITTESTLTSIPTLPTVSRIRSQRSVASSTTEGTRRSLRLVNRIEKTQPLNQARSASPRKRRRERDSLGDEAGIVTRGCARSNATLSGTTPDPLNE
ncbi:hypothetical protein BDV26DRAFT_205081 [Aspergillus bertholletiae]|uniref:Uncharacterized protein n=1 Tax=Aspergillus bertholletiae TaxID=1226010 RepID=A0A5N7B7Q4_9EURO|nr:hypothetical protein BDV26DRAFT_205081 [Aspergillus bertholletiae]